MTKRTFGVSDVLPSRDQTRHRVSGALPGRDQTRHRDKRPRKPPVVIRPATRADLDAFSPLPGKPTIRALCMEREGRIIALGGFVLSKGRWIAFADLSEEARRYKIHILRAAQRLFRDARRDGVRYIYTDADTQEPRSLPWLASLGFSLDPRSRSLYRWEG